MDKLVTIVATATNAQIKSATREVKNLVSDALSYKVAAAEHMKSSWDGVLSFYSYKTDVFPAGFVRLVVKMLQRNGFKVVLKRKPAPEPVGPARPVVDKYPPDPRYDYQPETMETLVKLKSMIAQVATGGGKSRIFKLCQQRIGLPTLFVTTRKSLMYQMADDFRENIGGSIGILGDGVWEPNYKGVNFAIVDTLVSRLEIPNAEKEVEKAITRNSEKIEKTVREQLKLAGLPENVESAKKLAGGKVSASDFDRIAQKCQKIRSEVERALTIPRNTMLKDIQTKIDRQARVREETVEFLKHIGFLCLEEAHEVGSDGFFRVAQACVNAHYRLALTATPFMRDDEGANMRLMAATGPVGIRITEKKLIDLGILATPYFVYKDTGRPPKLYASTAWQAAYRIGITDNDKRNLEIIKEVCRAKQYGLTSMVLVSHKTHGQALQNKLNAVGVRAQFIFGEHEQKERKQCLKQLGSGEIDCLIGSTILDVGVDVPSVGLVVIAGAGKAEVAIRQRIGRGLRAKKSGPNVAFIMDFYDGFNNNLVKHSRERRRIVESTPGFAENIVTKFDYEGLGFKQVK